MHWTVDGGCLQLVRVQELDRDIKVHGLGASTPHHHHHSQN